MFRPAPAVLLSAMFMSSVAHGQGGSPDFTVMGLTAPTGGVAYYDPVPVSFTLVNLGAAFTGNVAYEIAVVGGAGVPMVIQSGVAFLSANGMGAPVSASPMLPSTVSGGASLNVLIRVDPANLIAESNEGNNAVMSPQPFTVLGADLRANALTAPGRVTRGNVISVMLEIENTVATEARNFVYQYQLEPAAGPSIVLWTSPPMTLAGNTTTTMMDTVAIPLMAPLGAANLAVILDSTAVVPENSETNNLRRVAILITDPAPDFTISLSDLPMAVESGQQLDVSYALANGGDTDGTADFEVYLSTDATITTSDLSIGMGTNAAVAGGQTTGRVTLSVPGTATPGDYYIGAIVDPNDTVPEHDETNNTFVRGPIPLFPGDLEVATTMLPPGDVGLAYSARLVANGATNNAVWSVTQGALPPGLGLVGAEIVGRPSTPGIYSFVVQVTDGARTASAPLTLEIRTEPVPVTIATPSLPTAIVGVPYSVEIFVSGGRPPFGIAIDGLPPGLTAQGLVIEGTPTMVGTSVIDVEVTDGFSTATAQFDLTVLPSTSDLLLNVAELPTGFVGLDYCAGGVVRLEATGGMPPYAFDIMSGDVPGLTLAPDGSLCGEPTQVGTYTFVVRVRDATGSFDTGLFSVTVEADGLRVSTTSLPDAKVGAPYSATLEAERGTGALLWTLVSGDLPPGMSLSTDGVISGSSDVLATYTFAVSVRDDVGAEHVAPLSIRVVGGGPGLAAAPEEGCSCGTTAARPSALSVLFLFVLFAVRRR